MNIFARKQKSISLKFTWWFLSFEAEKGWISDANLSFPAGSPSVPFTRPQTRSCDIHQARWGTGKWCWHGWHPAASCRCFGSERACPHPVESCAESWFQGFPRPTSGPSANSAKMSHYICLRLGRDSPPRLHIFLHLLRASPHLLCWLIRGKRHSE